MSAIPQNGFCNEFYGVTSDQRTYHIFCNWRLSCHWIIWCVLRPEYQVNVAFLPLVRFLSRTDPVGGFRCGSHLKALSHSLRFCGFSPGWNLPLELQLLKQFPPFLHLCGSPPLCVLCRRSLSAGSKDVTFSMFVLFLPRNLTDKVKHLSRSYISKILSRA